MAQKVTFDQYQAALAEGRFLGLSCPACGSYTFPPKAVCRSCGASEMEPAEMAGRGVIRTYTVIRVPPEGFAPNYIVALTELDEGPQVMGRLEGVSPDEADAGLIGRPVTLGSGEMAGDVYTDACRYVTFHLAD